MGKRDKEFAALLSEAHAAGWAAGFAWVTIKGTGPLASYVRKETKAGRGRWRKGYPSGLQCSVWEFNQSIDRKYAYAAAFAKVLNAAGFTAYAESRMD